MVSYQVINMLIVYEQMETLNKDSSMELDSLIHWKYHLDL